MLLSSSQLGPWVTVICICFNHQPYLRQALDSVIDQHYPFLDLIVIDNGSVDQSTCIINDFAKQHSAVRYLRNTDNIGLNRAFNQGLALAQGQYIIDFSADDIMLPGRISQQVALFETLPLSYGVIFTNAALIDNQGHFLCYHYPIDSYGKARVGVPTGDVFIPVLASYFICTPTMMMRRTMLIDLGGYDETLSYEDFDLWVRSSRVYQYAYLDEVLTQKRQLASSLSMQVIDRTNTLLVSTWVICQKAFALCVSPEEFDALASRIQSFIRKAFYAEQFDIALQFGHLLCQIRSPNRITQFILVLSRLHFPVNILYRLYIQRIRKPVS